MDKRKNLNDHRIYVHNLSSCETNSDLEGIHTNDLCEIGGVLFLADWESTRTRELLKILLRDIRNKTEWLLIAIVSCLFLASYYDN